MSEPRITAQPGGPFVVSGGVPLVPRSPVVTADGEPVAWRNEPALEGGESYELCRCGGSANKPYCDNTHESNGFDGTDGEIEGTYESRSKVLGGTGITVRDDRSICTHAGFCGNRVSNVWRMVKETADSNVRAAVIAMVDRCPSGALSYEIDGESVEPDLRSAISPTPNGPYWVTGGIAVEKADGTVLERRKRVALCRCGASSRKPLCDGSHQDVGFQA